jgi:hypothetical protein
MTHSSVAATASAVYRVDLVRGRGPPSTQYRQSLTDEAAFGTRPVRCRRPSAILLALAVLKPPCRLEVCGSCPGEEGLGKTRIYSTTEGGYSTMALLGRCPMALAADIRCSSTGLNSRLQILLR